MFLLSTIFSAQTTHSPNCRPGNHSSLFQVFWRSFVLFLSDISPTCQVYLYLVPNLLSMSEQASVHMALFISSTALGLLTMNRNGQIPCFSIILGCVPRSRTSMVVLWSECPPKMWMFHSHRKGLRKRASYFVQAHFSTRLALRWHLGSRGTWLPSFSSPTLTSNFCLQNCPLLATNNFLTMHASICVHGVGDHSGTCTYWVSTQTLS